MRILTVVDYDEMWPTLFENERTLLQMTLGKVISRIHHIGSTSVPGLSAKPVIDILIEVANIEGLDSLNQASYRSTDWASYGRTTPAGASRNDSHAIRRHHELS